MDWLKLDDWKTSEIQSSSPDSESILNRKRGRENEIGIGRYKSWWKHWVQWTQTDVDMFRFFFAFCLCYVWRTFTHCADIHTHVFVCIETLLRLGRNRKRNCFVLFTWNVINNLTTHATVPRVPLPLSLFLWHMPGLAHSCCACVVDVSAFVLHFALYAVMDIGTFTYAQWGWK